MVAHIDRMDVLTAGRHVRAVRHAGKMHMPVTITEMEVDQVRLAPWLERWNCRLLSKSLTDPMQEIRGFALWKFTYAPIPQKQE